jgi:hypothetical protein
LANDAQAATKIPRCPHRRIAWKRSANFRQRMIERKISRDHLRGNAGEVKVIVALLHVNSLVLDRADETISRLLPMEDLSAVERFLQIEIRRNDLHGGSSARRSMLIAAKSAPH